MVVEATAVDRRGEIVRGLRASDFGAEIDGQAREVVSAEWVEYHDLPGPEERPHGDLTTNVESADRRTVLMVIDQSSLEFEGRGVLAGARRWLGDLGRHDRVGLVAIPAPGPTVEFTTDRTEVFAALDSLGVAAGQSPPPYAGRNVGLWEALQIKDRNDIVRAQVIARECQRRDPTCPGQIDENAQVLASDVQVRVIPVLSMLQQVIRGLQHEPGLKHVVLVSAGWPLNEREAPWRLAILAEDAARASAIVHVVTAESWAAAASLVHVSPTAALDRQLALSGVETLAGFTGGQSVRLTGTAAATLAPGQYTITASVEPGDDAVTFSRSFVVEPPRPRP